MAALQSLCSDCGGWLSGEKWSSAKDCACREFKSLIRSSSKDFAEQIACGWRRRAAGRRGHKHCFAERCLSAAFWVRGDVLN